MLNIANLTIGFGGPVPVLAEANCTLDEGQRLLVCGEAGSGKSTLLGVAAGLIPRLIHAAEFSGRVELAGRPLLSFTKKELFGTIGFVSQNSEDQLWDICVEDVIAFPLENRGVERSAIRNRLAELIAEFELEELRGRRVLTLSGGERRMVTIAAALASNPKILVLDEPTTGLDPAARMRLSNILQKVSGSVSTLLISEQDPLALYSVIDSIALLHGGNVSPSMPPKTVLTQHAAWAEAGILPPMRARPERRASETGRPLLTVLGLTSQLARSRGNPVFKDVGFDVRAGEVLALIGRNGAGKTTLFKSILGLLKTTSGTILFDGTNANEWSVAARARKIAYIPQNMRHILFNMSVLGEVIFAITASSASSSDPAVIERAKAALARYGLSDLAEANPFALSARQQALLGLACADATGALVAIIDEPLLSRDIKGRQMLELFISSMQSSGRAVMLISHDLELVDDLATRLMVLDNGKIAFEGSSKDGWQSDTFRSLGWQAPYDVAAWSMA
ncbi:ATP-binding cassette domain-containing protein [Rhizobium sp. P44RR-XXIV]|uniref:ABC transporter ATP-binding protein n=1 Tax=Rhizobium sp. P44RR-XXIV TaxID=1921145 RepID=UPI00098604C2|nr:ATP-binding cassette domain-containing protein [Rhizobium sp. P44RR-XXIV]TIX87364.1 ATP-binding cassette domain-containing protein [Rhizobium sp. P44RR-XXIV]